mgnify:CR=1 FL=1
MKRKDTFFDTNHLSGDIKNRAIRGGLVTSASHGIQVFLRFASIVVLARLLIPEHFGLIGMVTSLTILIERFQDLGLGDAIVQRKEITHEQVSTLFWINLAICAFFTLIVVLLAKLIAWFYGDERLIWITIALASNFVFAGSAIQHQALIRRQMRFDHFALIKIISITFGFGLAIVLAWQGYGYWALVWKELGRTFMNAVLAWSFCSWRPGLPVRNSGVRSMLKFGYNVTGYNMLFYLSNNLDSILIGKFAGAAPLGLYSRAKQLTAIPVGQLFEPIQYVSLPALGILQDNPQRYRSYFLKMLAVLCFLYMPIVVYLAIYAHPLVLLTLGPQWMAAVPIFKLLAIAMFLQPIVRMLGLILLSNAMTKRYLIWGLVNSIILVTAFTVGIQWSTIGVAASWSVAAGASFLFSLVFIFDGTPISQWNVFAILYRPVTASMVMGIVLWKTYDLLEFDNLLIQLALSILLGGFVYLITWLIFPGGYRKVMEFISYPLMVLKRKNAFSSS